MGHSISKELSEITDRKGQYESGQEVLIDRRLKREEQEIEMRR